MDKIRVGLIGAGLIGAMHGFALRSILDHLNFPLRLQHVADVDVEKARTYARNFGFARASADAGELLEDREVDAVYICTWTSEHPELVRAAAAEKKHVFCEKPLAFDLPQAREMQKAVEKAGVINQVGLVLRQGPVWNVLRHQLQSRETGFPISFLFRDDQCFPIKGAHPSTWRKDPRRAGHGTLLEHSIHDLDLVEWIFGPLTYLRARTSCRFGHPEIEDLAQVELEFASGMSGLLVSIWHDVLLRHSNRRLEVFHEKACHFLEAEFTGEIHYMAEEQALKTVGEAEVNRRFWELRGITDPRLQRLSTIFGVLEDYLFCRAVLQGEPAEPDFQTAVRAHQLVDACYESAKIGKGVRVDPPPSAEDRT